MNWAYKISGVIVAIAAVLTFSFLQEGQDVEKDADVKKNAEDYLQAYNSQDPDKLGALWGQDAVYINLTSHETLQGRNEIVEYFKEQFKKDGETNLKITIDNIKFDDSGKATERGTATTQTKGDPEVKSSFVAELTKVDNSWVLQKVFEVDLLPPITHYEQLKELEWLIGNWGNKNEYVDLSSTVNWNENKNFLIQKFTVEVLGQKNAEGEQIIGWDPIKKKIRSWVYDSDGGFGEGYWTKQGDQWYVGMAFTLPDGRKASSTQVYTKTDDHSFTFASEDRDVDGKMLPNIKPFKIIKMQ